MKGASDGDEASETQRLRESIPLRLCVSAACVRYSATMVSCGTTLMKGEKVALRPN